MYYLAKTVNEEKNTEKEESGAALAWKETRNDSNEGIQPRLVSDGTQVQCETNEALHKDIQKQVEDSDLQHRCNSNKKEPQHIFISDEVDSSPRPLSERKSLPSQEEVNEDFSYPPGVETQHFVIDEEEDRSSPPSQEPINEDLNNENRPLEAFVPARRPRTESQMLRDAPLVEGVVLDDKAKNLEQNHWKTYKWVYIIGIITITIAIAVTIGVAIGSKSESSTKTTEPTTVQPATDTPATTPPSGSTEPPTIIVTDPPTPCMTFSQSERLALALDDIEDALGYASNTLRDPCSSQYRAAAWLADEDNEIEFPLSSTSTTRLLQRYALVTFYFAANGDEWDNHCNFLSPVHECLWFNDATSTAAEITVITDPPKSGVVSCTNVNNEAIVSWIDIAANNMTGTIPSELFLLSDLYGISLISNNLHGSIPSTMYKLSNLIMLSLWDNNLSGPIHRDISSMESLYYLWLDSNDLSGTIPTSIGLLSSTLWLGLSKNKLTGVVPTEIGNLKQMENLDLQYNSLVGTLPDSLSQLNALTFLGFRGNQGISWNIPEAIQTLYPNMIQLYMSNMTVTGSIPESFTRLTTLNYLDLGYGQLTGSIPESIGDLTSLIYMHINDNELTGQMPTSVGNLSLLESLRMDSNQFSGPLPSELGKLTMLSHLIISYNKFTGPVPTVLVNLASLDILGIQMNYLTGNINFFCDANTSRQIHIMADCLGDEIDCDPDCCNICCNEGGTCDFQDKR